MVGHQPIRPIEGDGWYRLDHLDWTVILHTDPNGWKPKPSHGHKDFGSLVLFWKGQEILIDIGRSSYEIDDVMASYSTGSSAHNTVTINGHDICPTSADRLFPPKYRKLEFVVSTHSTAEKACLTLDHFGFDRLVSLRVKHRREVLFSKDSASINDWFEGVGMPVVEGTFQWASSPETQSSQFAVEVNHAPAATYKQFMVSGVDISSTTDGHSCKGVALGGLRFPQYGKREPCVTQTFSIEAELPFSVCHSITLRR